VQIKVGVSADLLAFIDGERGDVARSLFCRRRLEEWRRVQEGPTADVGRSPTRALETSEGSRETVTEPERAPSVALEDSQEATLEPTTEALSEPPAQPIYDPEGRGCIPRWS
jgi:hypothetical protein